MWCVAEGLTNTNAIGFSSSASNCISVGNYYGFYGLASSCVSYNDKIGFTGNVSINCYAEGSTQDGFSSPNSGSVLINCAYFNVAANNLPISAIGTKSLTVSGVSNASSNNFSPAPGSTLIGNAFTTLFGLSTTASMDIGAVSPSGTGITRGPLDFGAIRP